MAVHCAKCGEELLGAVNRCWRCGQIFALRPEIDGRPPVRVEMQAASQPPLEAVVLNEAAASAAPIAPIVAATVVAGSPPPSPAPYVSPQVTRHTKPSTAQLVDARRVSLMAMGGTVASLVLGLFALALALARFEAALIALLGLFMGIWGLYSPRRNWALIAMLICCLGIGLGSYTGARQLYIHIQKTRPPTIPDSADAPP